MMTQRARIWWGSGALLLVLAGGGLFAQKHFAPAPLPAGGRVAEVQPAAAQAWPIGERRIYAVTLSSKISLPQGDVMAVETGGKLEAVRLAGERLAIAVRYDVTEAKLLTSPADEAQLRAALGEAFAAQFDASGLLDTVSFAKAATLEPARVLSRGLLRTVVAGFQVLAPPDTGAASWTSEERDTVGLFAARYDKVGPAELRKTKTGYTRVTNANPLMSARTELDLASGALSFDGPRWSPQSLRNLSWSERSRMVSDGPLPKLEATQALTIGLLTRDRVDEAALQTLATAAAKLSAAKLDDRSAENRMSLDHSKLADKGFADVLRELANADPKDQRTQARLFSSLKTHLRFEPDSVAMAEKLIRQRSPQKSLLLDALGSAGSEVAQEVLRQVVKEDGFSADDKRRSMIALSFVETPAKDTVDFLRQQRTDADYGLQALYGLGTAANNLQASDPEAARALALELAAGLADTSDANKTVDQLTAVGNAANPATLDQLEALLKAPDPAVRAAAVWALRRIAGERADQGVALGLRDPEVKVRRGALEALSYRAPVPVLVYVVQESLTSEPDIIARREFVRAALRFSTVVPRLHAQLVAMAASDPDSKIRDMLAKLGRG